MIPTSHQNQTELKRSRRIMETSHAQESPKFTRLRISIPNQLKRRRSAMLTSNDNSSLTKISFLVMLLLFIFNSFAVNSLAQEPPLVYDQENTGASFPAPVLLPYAQLPFLRVLPDPFLFLDGTRDTSFANWERRRNEIKAMIEKWDIGPKPTKSDLIINAVYTPGPVGTLTVDVTRLSNGRTLRITAPIALPTGTAPAAGWPAMIEVAAASAALANGNIASIGYAGDDVTQYAAGQQIEHASDPYFLMYPEYNAGPCPMAPARCGATQVGQYAAWSWGVSRLIDCMEIAKNQPGTPLPIDLKHLGVHGCSYAGKMALWAGAFDERIALTHAQENGGGGAPAWRISQGIEPNNAVEKASNTDGSWFITKSQFQGNNAYKFPFDHHELMAMVAPRALIQTGNDTQIWLGNRANYITSRATKQIYEALGVGDRFAVAIDTGHGHCATPQPPVQAAVTAFYNRFLLGQDVPTDLFITSQRIVDENVDYQRWTQWWETGVPNDPRYNLALASLGATALGSTEHGSGAYPASAAIDGDDTGSTWGSGGGWSDNTPGVFPDILEVDFHGLVVLDEIHVVTLQNNWKTAGAPDETTPATG